MKPRKQVRARLMVAVLKLDRLDKRSKKFPSMGDLYLNCPNIEADATVILASDQPLQTNGKPQVFNVIKNRLGPTGKATLRLKMQILFDAP